MSIPVIGVDDIIDMHVHVGVRGDVFPEWGSFSEWYQKQLVFRVFLLYGRLKPSEVTDPKLIEATLEVINQSVEVRHTVCLALDPIYGHDGQRQEDASHMWVDNDYVLHLRSQSDRVLLGASVHPYANDFKERVLNYVEAGAVLLKWLPSAQHIDLADPKVAEALNFLATCRNGKPLPLLLHVGPEYAIPSPDPRTQSYDCLTWGWRDRISNLTRSKKWFVPDQSRIKENLHGALDAGAVIIFGHCGLPYVGRASALTAFEHDEKDEVRKYLRAYPTDHSTGKRGRCYADISALTTPMRREYFENVEALPPSGLLYGSDFPTPVFELSADLAEVWRDFNAVLGGDVSRVFIPQDNLLDVNYREMHAAFRGHALFVNTNKLFYDYGLATPH